MDLLEWAHDSLDLPWWCAIAVTNVLVRTAVLPLTILQQQKAGGMTEMTNASKDIRELHDKMARAATAAQYDAARRQYQVKMQEFNTNFKDQRKWAFLMPGLAILQAAVFISQFSAANTLARAEVPSMVTGGFAWFTDLTAPDSRYGLPVLCAVLTLAMFESGAMEAMLASSPNMKWIMRAFALVFIPAGAYVPAGVAVLWASNSTFALLQNGLLRLKAVRRVLKLPDIKEMQARMAAAQQQQQQASGALAALMGRSAGGAAAGGAGAVGGGGAAAGAAGAAGAPASAAAPAGAVGAGVKGAAPPPGMPPLRAVKGGRRRR